MTTRILPIAQLIADTLAGHADLPDIIDIEPAEPGAMTNGLWIGLLLGEGEVAAESAGEGAFGSSYEHVHDYELVIQLQAAPSQRAARLQAALDAAAAALETDWTLGGEILSLRAASTDIQSEDIEEGGYGFTDCRVTLRVEYASDSSFG